MKTTLKQLSIGLAAAGMLTIYGCGGGGGGGATAAAPATTTTTVTPSLGRFSVGTVVNLNKASDNSLLSTGTIGSNGSVTLSLAGYTGPVVVTVVGAAGVTYFDEGTGSDQPFTTGTLRAVVPNPLAQVGVSALTNAAVANLEAAGGIASATTATINDANAKIAAVFGLPDILVAPTPVGLDTPANTLDLASPADKYALILAAFAKSAPSGNAAALTINLALDMKDGILDAKDGKGSSPTTLIPNALTAAALKAAYQTVAVSFATPGSLTIVKNTPLVVTEDVKLVSGDPTNPVNLAKAMFAELRTTLNSFANGGKTGFLDTQATRMQDDLTANVAPEMTKVANRISALGNAVGVFEDAANFTINNNQGFYTHATPTFTGDPTGTSLMRQKGDLLALWNGYSSSFDICWTDSATGVTNKVSCAHADSNTIDRANNKIKMVVFEVTKTAANQYAYKATRYNQAVASGPSFNTLPTLVTKDSQNTPMPTGSGTFTKAFNASSIVTGFEIKGTLPPSASSPDNLIITKEDNISIAATRTALATTNNYRYALTGAVSTAALTDASKVVTLSLDNGSYIDLNEPTLAATGPQIVGAKFLGTAQTAATKFTGSIDVSAFATSKNAEYSPTSIVFNGSITDIRPTIGSGQILTGKLEATVVDYANFDSNAIEAPNNFLHATMTFTGTVQAPSRPLLKLIAAVTKTGPQTGSTTLNYSYGTTSITGSGTIDNGNAANNAMILSNQNGITVDTKTGFVTKSSTKVATLANGSIAYVDGVTESLN